MSVYPFGNTIFFHTVLLIAMSLVLILYTFLFDSS